MGLSGNPGAAAQALFLAVGLPWGLVLAVLFPPFGMADEPAHFYRAYAVASGQLGVIQRAPVQRPADSVDGALAGVLLPASLRRLETRLGGTVRGRPESRLRPRTIVAALGEPMGGQELELVDVRTAAQFPFVPYLPQAAGIACGRLFGATPLLLFYCARLSNLLVSSVLIALAIAQMPSRRWFLALAALAPMAVSLRASVSADALTIAAAFLTLATVAKLACGPEPSRPARDFWVLGLSACLLCATKLPYAPLAAGVLLIPARRWPGGRRGPAFAALLAAAAAAAAWSVAVAMSLHVQLRPDADRARQIRDAFAEPLRAAAVMAADAWTHGPRYLAQLVGVQLGWLDTRLPWLLVLSYMALLAWLAMADGEGGDGIGLGAGPRLFLAALALAVTVLVIASQYAAFTPYRAASVDGVQGRYFLPLLPAAALALRGRGGRSPGSNLSSRGAIAGLAAFAAAAAAATCLAVAARFYG